MPRRTKQPVGGRASLDRRGFLKAATLAGSGAVAQVVAAEAPATANSPARHTVQVVAREAEQGAPRPVYSAKVLSDSDIADIVAYLQSIPRSPDVKDIPLLNR